MVARRCVTVRAGYGAIHIPPISDGDRGTEVGEGRARCHRPRDRRSLHSVDQPARAIEDVDCGNLERLARPVIESRPVVERAAVAVPLLFAVSGLFVVGCWWL